MFLIEAGLALITIIKRNGNWHGSVKAEDDSFEKYSEKNYPESDRIKLAAFDLVTKLLYDKQKKTNS